MTSRIVSIQGSTEVELSYHEEHSRRSVVRSHPDYREKGLWMDWVDICWETEDLEGHDILLPAQVLMVLNFDSIVYEDIPRSICDLLFTTNISINQIEGTFEQRNGVHLLVHSAADDGIRDFDPFKDSIVHHYVMEPFFQLVSLDNVERICFVARDAIMEGDDPMVYSISTVIDPNAWGSIFLPRFAKNYEDPEDDDHQSDEFNEYYNPW